MALMKKNQYSRCYHIYFHLCIMHIENADNEYGIASLSLTTMWNWNGIREYANGESNFTLWHFYVFTVAIASGIFDYSTRLWKIGAIMTK